KSRRENYRCHNGRERSARNFAQRFTPRTISLILVNKIAVAPKMIFRSPSVAQSFNESQVLIRTSIHRKYPHEVDQFNVRDKFEVASKLPTPRTIKDAQINEEGVKR